LAPVLLRRRIACRTVDAGPIVRAGLTLLAVVSPARCAKIDQTNLAQMRLQDDVGGLDILMDHGPGRVVQVFQYPTDLYGVPDHLLSRQAAQGSDRAAVTMPRDKSGQVFALDVLHDDVEPASFLEEAINAGNARVAQAGECASLFFESPQGFGPLIGITRVIVFEHLFDDA